MTLPAPRPTPVLLGVVLLATVACSPGAVGDDAAVSSATGAAATATDDAEVALVATMHRTPECSCCAEHAAHLEGAGFTVAYDLHDDLVPVRAAFGVPEDERSCHTLEVGGYAVEGHVPAEAIGDLLASAPEVDGISLAGMPLGSPGMPGRADGPFEVRTFEAGQVLGTLGSY